MPTEFAVIRITVPRAAFVISAHLLSSNVPCHSRVHIKHVVLSVLSALSGRLPASDWLCLCARVSHLSND